MTMLPAWETTQLIRIRTLLLGYLKSCWPLSSLTMLRLLANEPHAVSGRRAHPLRKHRMRCCVLTRGTLVECV